MIYCGVSDGVVLMLMLVLGVKGVSGVSVGVSVGTGD